VLPFDRPAEALAGHNGHMSTDPQDPALLATTWFIDHDHPRVAEFVSTHVRDQLDDPISMAIGLFHAVRDGFRYDPYATDYRPEAFRASAIADSKANWCVPKSVLLTAAARHCGIPAKLGFADVRNHLSSEKLTAQMGTDLFAWHGYSELWLNGRWFKLSTAFNVELCERFGVKVLEFDGTADALMHPFDTGGNRHMEYVRQRGSYLDLPLKEILATFDELYGPKPLTDPQDRAFGPEQDSAG
jgi:transglutaminase-like putative cysteine protease